jgi:hypothetical protein
LLAGGSVVGTVPAHIRIGGIVDQRAETVVNPYFETCKINPIGFEDVVLVFGRGEDVGEDYKTVEFVDGLGGGVGTEFVVDDEREGD